MFLKNENYHEFKKCAVKRRISMFDFMNVLRVFFFIHLKNIYIYGNVDA
jgi:hypothetical protein